MTKVTLLVVAAGGLALTVTGVLGMWELYEQPQNSPLFVAGWVGLPCFCAGLIITSICVVGDALIRIGQRIELGLSVLRPGLPTFTAKDVDHLDCP
jgi:hypothetical protein